MRQGPGLCGLDGSGINGIKRAEGSCVARSEGLG